jgi:hypothetical protein
MFHELLDNTGLDPGTSQSAARQKFPLIVTSSHLDRRMLDDPVPVDGKYIIIGIASYSPLGLRLLDEIEAAYGLWKDVATIAVFDLMECKNVNDVWRFLQKNHDVRQTPAVEIWDGGEFITFKTGLPATREVLRKAGVLK